MKNKVSLLNMISGLILQICTMISGFILPRIILLNFGSDVNGLVSSLSQFLSYINLLEGGITSVILANLYKPLAEGNQEKINSIVTVAKKFFDQIGIIFIVYSIIVACIYPVVFNVKFDYFYVWSLTIILSISLSVQCLFSLTLRTLLNADKKVYIVSFSQTVIVILNIFFVYISTLLYPSIHLVKFLGGMLYIIQPWLYGRYVKKHYEIDWNARPDKNLIKDRWNGFAINFAAFIHNSTDITILTIFTNLQTVSIYSVYNMITYALRQLISGMTSGINSTIGHAYVQGNNKELNEKLDLYEYIVFLLVSFLFTATALLLMPFVMIYTDRVNDANYYQPLFGILLVISEASYLIKFPHLNLAYAANKFKEITTPACIEAIVNIVISLILVKQYGIKGVAVGTIVAMLYRMVFHVYYTSKIIPNRPQYIFYRKLLIFLSTSVAIYFACTWIIPINNYTVLNWVLHAIAYCTFLGIAFLLVSKIFFDNELRYFIRYLKRR